MDVLGSDDDEASSEDDEPTTAPKTKSIDLETLQRNGYTCAGVVPGDMCAHTAAQGWPKRTTRPPIEQDRP